MEGTTPQGQTEQVELHLLQVASSSATSLARVSSNTAGLETTEKWTLPDYVAKALSDDGEGQRCGRIGPVQNCRLLNNYQPSLQPSEIHLGLLSDRGKSRQVKLSHLHSLVRRGHADGQDAAEFTRCMLLRFKEREPEIALQHSPDVLQRWWNTRDLQLVEDLLIDAAFILERLLQHWEAGTRSSTMMRPMTYRYDLVVLPNQIPYMLLQELMQMVKLPPLPDKCGGSRDEFLMRIAIGYIVAEEASEWLLTKYRGPVHHLLHLVHLHLASAVEQRPRLPRLSLWARCKALGRHTFWEAIRSAKQALRRTRNAAEPQLLGTAWWSYSMIPPARDLDRVGIRLQPKKGTRCRADVCFRNGVLELPQMELVGYDNRLLVNLVALELEWDWESSRRLFLSYALFMSELMSSERDVTVLQRAGVFLENSREKQPTELPPWLFYRLLAELNNGRELHGHFVHLAREINSSYEHLNRASACARSLCFSGSG